MESTTVRSTCGFCLSQDPAPLSSARQIDRWGSGRTIMLTYKAMYRDLPEAVEAEVLDSCVVITWGGSLDEARRLLASAPEDVAQTSLLRGETLPQPDPGRTGLEADLEDPMYLILKAASPAIIGATEGVS